VVVEQLDVGGVLQEVAAGPDGGRVSLSTERHSMDEEEQWQLGSEGVRGGAT
jgi:hypothetical protein